MKKMKLSRLIMAGAVIGVVGYVVNFFAGSNMPMLIGATILTGLSGLPLGFVGGLMLIDCGEYNKLKGLPSSLGTMTAFQSFASKVGSGVGTWLQGMLLSIGGFISAGADGVAVMNQPSSAILTIRLGYSLIPALMFVLIIVVLHFYKLESLLPVMRKEKENE